MWTRNLSHYNRTNLLLWLALTFQAGMINAGGFLACHRFVTHATGFATQFGAEFAYGHWLNAAGMLSVPLFFLGGAMFSAFFTDRRISKGLDPRYTLVVGVIALILFSVSMAGVFGFFGVFGEPLNIHLDYTLLAMLCCASGMQNAAVTSASGAVLRTTHLTGVITDLGIGFVRLLSKQKSDRLQETEYHAVLIRLCLISGFVLGSTVGAFLFLKLKYQGFLMPTLISTILFLLGVRSHRRRQQQKAQTQRQSA